MDYLKKIEIKTVFGNVKIEYVAKYTIQGSTFNGMIDEVRQSHYIAQITDGDFNGWNATGLNRDTSLANLLESVARKYAFDICSI